jgi:hypothetical protein
VAVITDVLPLNPITLCCHLLDIVIAVQVQLLVQILSYQVVQLLSHSKLHNNQLVKFKGSCFLNEYRYLVLDRLYSSFTSSAESHLLKIIGSDIIQLNLLLQSAFSQISNNDGVVTQDSDVH